MVNENSDTFGDAGLKISLALFLSFLIISSSFFIYKTLDGVYSKLKNNYYYGYISMSEFISKEKYKEGKYSLLKDDKNEWSYFSNNYIDKTGYNFNNFEACFNFLKSQSLTSEFCLNKETGEKYNFNEELNNFNKQKL